ncbi:MAG: type II toxin-antitoxin system VapC family toxin [Gammaproteobacteria bacterium]
MKLLLDTHALLWWWLNDPQLSAKARKHVASGDNEIFTSAASAWEIATKHRLGKLGLPDLTIQRYQSLLASDGFFQLAITTDHALLAGSYAQSHADPFDRMLVAQAEIEGLSIISHDRALAQFGATLIW